MKRKAIHSRSTTEGRGDPPDEARAHPAAVVVAFAAAYTAWQTTMAEAKDAFGSRKLKAEHARVLASYCTNRRRAHVDGVMHRGWPPTYAGLGSNAITTVRRVKPGRAHVHVYTGPGTFERLFVVLNTRDGWRIDSTKYRTRSKRAWDNILIGS